VAGEPACGQVASASASATAAQASTEIRVPEGVVSCRDVWVRIRSILGAGSRLPSASRSATTPVTSAVASELPEAKS